MNLSFATLLAASRPRSLTTGSFSGRAVAPRRAKPVATARSSLVVRAGVCDVDPESVRAYDAFVGGTLDEVPRLSDFIPNIEYYKNPLGNNEAFKSVDQFWVDDEDMIMGQVVANPNKPRTGVLYRRAGARKNVVFNPSDVRVAIVTCGGLCPGLNTVTRELVYGLWEMYGVRHILGIESGYRGFYSQNMRELNPKNVDDIHKKGGTVLGSSRGGANIPKIVDSIADRGINQIYIIGGDGTQRGSMAIFEEIKKRGIKCSVCGIPKTIDNDVAVIDKSFGFDTAVEEAQRAINAAHTEAESYPNGIGLVRLMGRSSGFIAMNASLASCDVDLCLIPEVKFWMDGAGGVFEYIKSRIEERGHCVVVVAEGAGQDLVAQYAATQGAAGGAPPAAAKPVAAAPAPVAAGAKPTATPAAGAKGVPGAGTDASGNKVLMDPGQWIAEQIRGYFKRITMEVSLKYLDPTYTVRAIPANASDNIYCTLLSHSAIHGVFGGYTGFCVGPVNGRHAMIPLSRICALSPTHVNLNERMWARLLSSTGQPPFVNKPEEEEDDATKRKEKKAASLAAAAAAKAATAAAGPAAAPGAVSNGNGNGAKPEPAVVNGNGNGASHAVENGNGAAPKVAAAAAAAAVKFV